MISTGKVSGYIGEGNIDELTMFLAKQLQMAVSFQRLCYVVTVHFSGIRGVPKASGN